MHTKKFLKSMRDEEAFKNTSEIDAVNINPTITY